MRTEPTMKLERSPLILVLAQIRFNPVLKMADFVPSIQEAMRGEGMVRYRQEETQQVVFGPVVKTNQTTRWVFSNREQNQAVVLANDFFVFEVSNYDVFESFVESLQSLLLHIKREASLSFSTQVGLRYVDLVQPGGGRSVDDFISPSLRGLSASDLGVEVANHQFAIQCQTDLGTLYFRSYENTGEQFLPPDLQTEHLKFPEAAASSDEFRILDFDHVGAGEVEFEGNALSERLWKLHDYTKRAFKAATTDEAIKHWKGDGK